MHGCQTGHFRPLNLARVGSYRIEDLRQYAENRSRRFVAEIDSSTLTDFPQSGRVLGQHTFRQFGAPGANAFRIHDVRGFVLDEILFVARVEPNAAVISSNWVPML